jgi:7,8-dihydropterin-6-yl-methyl-4-(beta-D-ribofuranosyl)aminobenzene 5'-phosphate synthase
VREGNEWQPDPYRDDLSLVLRGDEGLVVLCGCCHAGLLNTLRHLKVHFGGEIVAVIGGTHLNSATDEMIGEPIELLRSAYGNSRLYVNHCTGEGAYLKLASAFGDRVGVCPVGTVFSI